MASLDNWACCEGNTDTNLVIIPNEHLLILYFGHPWKLS